MPPIDARQAELGGRHDERRRRWSPRRRLRRRPRACASPAAGRAAARPSPHRPGGRRRRAARPSGPPAPASRGGPPSSSSTRTETGCAVGHVHRDLARPRPPRTTVHGWQRPPPRRARAGPRASARPTPASVRRRRAPSSTAVTVSSRDGDVVALPVPEVGGDAVGLRRARSAAGSGRRARWSWSAQSLPHQQAGLRMVPGSSRLDLGGDGQQRRVAGRPPGEHHPDGQARRRSSRSGSDTAGCPVRL